MAWSTRPNAMQALARPLWISVPEWPPASPRTVTDRAAPSQAARATGRAHRTMLPPAQLTVKTPSASESRFSSFRPRRGETSRAMAPSIPISSSVVRTTSSRGWGIDGSSRMARAMAAAMPSSPPRVVPRART